MILRTATDIHRPLVALGSGLLATAVVLSTGYTRESGDLDWSNYLVGLAATAGLLGIAVITARGLGPVRAGRTSEAAAWPGAFGAVGAGLMVGIGLDDAAATTYLAALVVLALSVLGWLVTWREPYVVTAVLGLFVLLTEAYDDLFGIEGDASSRMWPAALALVIFAVAVTAASWLLPAVRVAAGVTAGAIAAVGLATLTGSLALASLFAGIFEIGFDTAEELSGDPSFAAPEDPFDQISTDTWVTLLLALALVVFWALCAAQTGAIGFRILLAATAVAVTPLATVALRSEHPTWWGVVVGAAGGLALLAALRQRDPARDEPGDVAGAAAGPAGQPINP